MSTLERQAYQLLSRLDEELEEYEESLRLAIPVARAVKLRRLVEAAERRLYRRGKETNSYGLAA